MTTKRSKGSLVSSVASKRASKETAALEAILGGPLTLGMALESLRRGDEMSQAEFARKLGHPIEVFVRLALQDQVNDGGLKLKVIVQAA